MRLREEEKHLGMWEKEEDERQEIWDMKKKKMMRKKKKIKGG